MGVALNVVEQVLVVGGLLDGLCVQTVALLPLATEVGESLDGLG